MYSYERLWREIQTENYLTELIHDFVLFLDNFNQSGKWISFPAQLFVLVYSQFLASLPTFIIAAKIEEDKTEMLAHVVFTRT